MSRKKDVSLPEAVPDNLPRELHDEFRALAEQYEENFRVRFQDGLPHPAAHFSQHESFVQTHIPHTYEYKHVVQVEPQVMLPVPAHFLFDNGISRYQREQMLHAGAQHLVTSGPQNAFVETKSSAKPAKDAGGAAGGPIPDPLMMGSLVDPYPGLIPSALSVGAFQGNVAWTPSSLSAWGPGGFGAYAGNVGPPLVPGTNLGVPTMGVTVSSQPMFQGGGNLITPEFVMMEKKAHPKKKK